MNVFVAVSTAFLGLLIFGFLIGFARNWCKALVRLIIILIDLIVSIFFSPLISKTIMNKVLTGTTLNIFSYSVDFEEIFKEYIGANFGEDFNLVQGQVTSVAKSLANVVVNIFIFYAMFILIALISLIVFEIVWLVVKIATKEEDEEEKERKARKKETSLRNQMRLLKERKKNDGNPDEQIEINEQPQNLKNQNIQRDDNENETNVGLAIGLRVIGGLEGLVTMIIIFFALLLPMFGAMDICGHFITDESSTPAGMEVASAYSADNLICGELFYTNETIKKVESYIDEIQMYKADYDDSIVGRVFNFTRIGKLGTKVFNYLMVVEYKDYELDFTNEMVAIIKSYNMYKENFIDFKFDISDSEKLATIEEFYSAVTSSTIAGELIENIVPTLAERWVNGEKFFSFSNPISGEYQVISNDFLKIFKSTKSISRINFNVRAILNALKIANNKNFIQNLKQNGIISALGSDDTVVKELIMSLVTTEELKNNLPIMLSDMISVLYDNIVGDGNFVGNDENSQFAVEDWEEEAGLIQQIVSQFVKVYNDLQNSQETNNDSILNELGEIGKLIDLSRKSKTLSTPLKSFIIGYIKSENVRLENESVKEELTSYINDKWSLTENPSFSFEETFSVLAETAEIANSFSSNLNEIPLDNLSNTLKNIIGNETLKTNVQQILNETNIVSSIIGDSDESIVITELVVSFIENSTEESLENDIKAGEAVLNIVSKENLQEFEESEIDDMIESIANSKAIMKVIEDAVENEDSSLQNLVDNAVSDEDALLISIYISNLDSISDLQKQTLISLFGYEYSV